MQVVFLMLKLKNSYIFLEILKYPHYDKLIEPKKRFLLKKFTFILLIFEKNNQKS